MKRNQALHERLIPLLVEGVGANSYLELGTHMNATISKVVCDKRYGVDKCVLPLDGVTMFAMTTVEFVEVAAARFAPYDFVFIDADHSRDAVKADFYGILPHVSEEGIVCLHDTNPDNEKDTEPGFSGDAWKFAHAMSFFHECVTLPYNPGLTIVRKRKRWGPAK